MTKTKQAELLIVNPVCPGESLLSFIHQNSRKHYGESSSPVVTFQ